MTGMDMVYVIRTLENLGRKKEDRKEWDRDPVTEFGFGILWLATEACGWQEFYHTGHSEGYRGKCEPSQ